MSEPSADSAPPPSLGWLAAHALDAGQPSPFRGAAFARAAAEGLRSLAGRPEAESSWNEFARPFRAAAEHADSIRDPLRGSAQPASPGMTGLGEAAGAALRGLAAPEEKTVRPMGDRALAGIGSRLGEALAGQGSPFQPAPQGMTRPPVAKKNASAVPPAKPAPAKPRQASRPPAEPESLPAPRPIRREDLPPARTAFEAWAEKLDRKARQARERDKRPAPARPSASIPPKRVPFIPPEDPADLARFKEILSRRAPDPAFPSAGTTGAVQPRPEPDGPSDTVTPVAPPYPVRPVPAGPGVADGISRLPAPGPAPAAPGETDTYVPVQPPAPDQGLPTAPSPAGPSPRGPIPGTAAPQPSARPRPSEMEWLDEEDDLAARLHSLLRRQARRRGVDLS